MMILFENKITSPLCMESGPDSHERCPQNTRWAHSLYFRDDPSVPGSSLAWTSELRFCFHSVSPSSAVRSSDLRKLEQHQAPALLAGGLFSRSAAQPASCGSSRSAVPISLCATLLGSSVFELARSAGAAHRPFWLETRCSAPVSSLGGIPFPSSPLPSSLSTSAPSLVAVAVLSYHFSHCGSVWAPQERSPAHSCIPHTGATPTW